MIEEQYEAYQRQNQKAQDLLKKFYKSLEDQHLLLKNGFIKNIYIYKHIRSLTEPCKTCCNVFGLGCSISILRSLILASISSIEVSIGEISN